MHHIHSPMDASQSNMVSKDIWHADYGKARNQTTTIQSVDDLLYRLSSHHVLCSWMLNVNGTAGDQDRPGPGVSAQSPQALLSGFFGENTHADR